MFDSETLHHAYFIEGDRDLIIADIDLFLETSLKINRAGNPDVHFAIHDSFGIDEGKSLQEMQNFRSITGGKKIFILAINSITNEAQNSLLKVFEEPTPGAHFFVISSSQRILLPTLRSRMVVISHLSAKHINFVDEARKFIKMPVKNRMEYVAGIIEEKDKNKAEEIIQAIVSVLGEKGLRNKSKETADMIKELLLLVQYLKDRSSSIKLILERVALMNF